MKTDAHRSRCWVCRARRIAAVLFFLSLLPALAHARELRAEPPSAVLLQVEAGGLTADEVAHRAVETSPDLDAKLREVDAAAAQVDAALVGFFPRLKTQATYNHLSYVEPAKFGGGVQAPGAPAGPLSSGTQLVNTPPESFPSIRNSTDITTSLTFPVTDVLLRVSRDHAAASRSARAARLNALATRLKVQTDARLAYYGWLRAKLQTEVAARSVVQARQHLEDVQVAFRADKVAKADVLRVESQLADAELTHTRARNLVTYTGSQLAIIMHVTPGAEFAVGEDVLKPLSPVSTGTVAALTDEAADNRPEMHALAASAEAQRQQAASARGAGMPQLSLVGSTSYSNPSSRVFPQTDTFTSTWALGVQASISPNDIASGILNGKVYDRKAASTEAQRRSLRDSLALEVAQSVQDIDNADAAVESTARGLAAAQEGYRVRRLLFLAGRATSVELTDSETELTRAGQAAADARVDQRVSRERFLHAVGRDAPSGSLP
ncbi:MAG TPA: TolC family protein [Myxococcaceae bacterium]|nr:TolC family protein [Myxococcaceae bacterium]